MAGYSTSIIAEKLKMAGSVAERVSEKIVTRADALIAREGSFEGKMDKAFAPHESIMEQNEKGMDDLERKLALLSNEDPSGQSKTG